MQIALAMCLPECIFTMGYLRYGYWEKGLSLSGDEYPACQKENSGVLIPLLSLKFN